MNRFTLKKTSSHLLRRILSGALVLGFAVFLLLKFSHSLQDSASSSQTDSLRQAILRSAVHCYAMEGAYPESLDYLRDHYGISWDENRYIVDYEITGSNLMPDVNIFPVNSRGGDS